jgi:hypothetical protein
MKGAFMIHQRWDPTAAGILLQPGSYGSRDCTDTTAEIYHFFPLLSKPMMSINWEPSLLNTYPRRQREITNVSHTILMTVCVSNILVRSDMLMMRGADS